MVEEERAMSTEDREWLSTQLSKIDGRLVDIENKLTKFERCPVPLEKSKKGIEGMPEPVADLLSALQFTRDTFPKDMPRWHQWNDRVEAVRALVGRAERAERARNGLRSTLDYFQQKFRELEEERERVTKAINQRNLDLDRWITRASEWQDEANCRPQVTASLLRTEIDRLLPGCSIDCQDLARAINDALTPSEESVEGEILAEDGDLVSTIKRVRLLEPVPWPRGTRVTITQLKPKDSSDEPTNI